MNASELNQNYSEPALPRFSNEELTRRVRKLEKVVDFLMQHLRIDLIEEYHPSGDTTLILNPSSEYICLQRDHIARGEEPK